MANTSWGSAGSSGWGGSTSTWGGKTSSTSYVHLPRLGKKTPAQSVAARIMAGAKAKQSRSHESVLGRILGGANDVTGNLVGDVVGTAENLPSGLLKIATTNPEDTAKAIGKDYKTRYGALFSGNFGKFAHQLEQHPLSYILDAATVGTLGTGQLARAGILSNELSTTGLSLNRAATAAGESARVPVNLARNPFTRMLQKGTYKVQSKLPENIPVLGENAAASRAVAQEYQHSIANPELFPLTDASKVKNPLHQGNKPGSSYSTRYGWQPEKVAPTDLPSAIRKEFKAKYGEEVVGPSLNKYAHAVGVGGPLGKSTQVWKDVVLAGRPAFQINNIVGNTGMTGLAGGLFGGSKGIALATKGDLNRAADFFKGSMHAFGTSEKGAGTGWYRRAVNKSYGLQGKFELVDRKAVMYAVAMRQPEIKQLVREGTGRGLSEGDALAEAFQTAFKGDKGAMLHREIRNKVDDAMGDYTRYSAGEQRLKKIIPFYGWNRHASRFLYATSRDRPGQLLVMNQLSRIGEQAHNKWGFLGTPDFMRGYVKIGGHTIDTAPLNPIKGATDTLKSVKEIVSGNPSTEGTDLSSNLNPIIAAGVQALSGKNLLTGAPIPKTAHGLLGSVVQQTVTGLPQYKLAAKAIPGQGGLDTSNPHTFLTPTGRLKAKFVNQDTGAVKLDKNGFPVEAPGRHMLNPTFQSLIATFLGVPDRGSVNLKTAQTVAKKIETDKNSGKFRPAKKRKKTSSLKAIQNTQRSGGWGAGQSGWGS